MILPSLTQEEPHVLQDPDGRQFLLAQQVPVDSLWLRWLLCFVHVDGSRGRYYDIHRDIVLHHALALGREVIADDLAILSFCVSAGRMQEKDQHALPCDIACLCRC